MEHTYGPMVKAVALILQAYKATIFVCADIEKASGGQIEHLPEAFVILFNEEFFTDGDRVDGYLERVFDVLSIPKQPVLRKACAIAVLNYLTNQAKIIETIKTILTLKAEYEASPDKFLEEHK